MLVHAIILVLIVFIRVFYNHTRLRSIPGPVFAGISGLWRGCVQKLPGYRQTLSELHQRHGKVVRIGPNVVSVCDPVAIARIYGVDIDWKKPTQDERTISLREGNATYVHVSDSLRNYPMRSIASRNGELRQYEGTIDLSARDLISALQRHRVQEITSSFYIFASEFAHKTFAEAVLKGKHETEEPPSTMEHLLFCSPIVRMKRRQYIFSCTFPRRYPCTPSQTGHGSGLLDRNGVVEQNEHLAVVESGIDSISTAFVSTFVLLMRHPRTMARVREEIDTAFYNGNLSDPLQWREASRLRYLDAVLKESLRHGRAPMSSIERSGPTGGATIDGHHVPEGAIVEWQVDALHCDSDIYGEDVEGFRPERWLVPNTQKRKRMEHSLLAFNISRLTCAPVRAIWLELKNVVISILLEFNMQLLEADDACPEDEDMTVEYTPRMMVNFVPRTH